jgi:exosortase
MLLLLVPCGLAALLLWRSAIPGVQLLMLPPVLLLAVLAAFGPAVARAAAVPIMFLYFAAPLWNFVLTAPLQDLTTRVAAILAPVLGLPATVHGHLVSFPNGITFEVTPACSGAGFLVQGLAIATLLGELEQARLGRRLRLLGSMVLVALVANWVRVLVIIELGYSSGMRSTLATRDHVAFGYFLFVLILAAYLWVASRRPLPPAAEPRVAQAAEPAWRPRIAYALVILVLASTPVLVAALIPLRTPPATVPAAESPRTRAAPADRWQLLAFTAGRSPTDGLS